MRKSKAVPVTAFQAGEDFLAGCQKLVREEVIPYQYDILNDRLPGVEKSHAVENLRLAARVTEGEAVEEHFYGMVFQDSDLAKWLEAAAYSLAAQRSEETERKIDEVVELLRRAQQPDGYLNSYFTVKEPDKRWINLQEAHELYCAGHLMEAACAYYEATGKDQFLKIMEKNADCLYEQFMKHCPHGYSGHPEIELALLRLYRASGEKKYLELAGHFVDVRGESPNYFIEEKARRNWNVWGPTGNDAKDTDYTQSTLPVREQKDAVGHAVRAVYLYTAMADLAGETGDKALRAACERLWDSIVSRQMYVTGGIGSTVLGEAFTVDYDLPNATVYAETCASIGLIFFARQMLLLEAKGEYADVMERALYNTVLAGMQLDGKRFFYVNPLEVVPGISGVAATQRHDLPERPQWYACACCPPNVARLLSSIGSYAYSENGDTLFAHLYLSGTVKTEKGFGLCCETEYPHGGEVRYTVQGSGRLALRIPAWSEETRLKVNGQAQEVTALVRDGYAYLEGLKEGDTVALSLDMTPRKVYASTRVAADTGCAAVQRGPLVYCAEGADNGGDVLSLQLAQEGSLRSEELDNGLLGGVVPVTADGYRIKTGDALYTTKKPVRERVSIRLIPYYAWGNRGLHQMRVWLPEGALAEAR